MKRGIDYKKIEREVGIDLSGILIHARSVFDGDVLNDNKKYVDLRDEIKVYIVRRLQVHEMEVTDENARTFTIDDLSPRKRVASHH